MTVTCPDCRTEYLLPDHLMGPRGARVRCPQCGHKFVVRREGQEGQEAPADATTQAEASPPPTPESRPVSEHAEALSADPESVANELIAELDARIGPRLAEARARGKVLAEVGPELMATFDAYRKRLGSAASDEVFRRVLQERLGLSFGARPR
jgi:predicted Zn finger-like uncharacterized protein